MRRGVRINECAGQVAPPQTHYKMRGNEQFQSANRRRTSLASGICGIASRWPIDICSHRRPFCICFYCICCAARVGLRRILHPFRRVTAHASRNSAHDGEGERKRGLVTVVHRVNYIIFAALCVGFRGSELPCADEMQSPAQNAAESIHIRLIPPSIYSKAYIQGFDHLSLYLTL